MLALLNTTDESKLNTDQWGHFLEIASGTEIFNLDYFNTCFNRNFDRLVYNKASVENLQNLLNFEDCFSPETKERVNKEIVKNNIANSIDSAIDAVIGRSKFSKYLDPKTLHNYFAYNLEHGLHLKEEEKLLNLFKTILSENSSFIEANSDLLKMQEFAKTLKDDCEEIAAKIDRVFEFNQNPHKFEIIFDYLNNKEIDSELEFVIKESLKMDSNFTDIFVKEFVISDKFNLSNPTEIADKIKKVFDRAKQLGFLSQTESEEIYKHLADSFKNHETKINFKYVEAFYSKCTRPQTEVLSNNPRRKLNDKLKEISNKPLKLGHDEVFDVELFVFKTLPDKSIKYGPTDDDTVVMNVNGAEITRAEIAKIIFKHIYPDKDFIAVAKPKDCEKQVRDTFGDIAKIPKTRKVIKEKIESYAREKVAKSARKTVSTSAIAASRGDTLDSDEEHPSVEVLYSSGSLVKGSKLYHFPK